MPKAVSYIFPLHLPHISQAAIKLFMEASMNHIRYVEYNAVHDGSFVFDVPEGHDCWLLVLTLPPPFPGGRQPAGIPGQIRNPFPAFFSYLLLCLRGPI